MPCPAEGEFWHLAVAAHKNAGGECLAPTGECLAPTKDSEHFTLLAPETTNSTKIADASSF